MNLKNNKGYAATDISIAVIILLILVPTIMGIVYNANINRTELSIKVEAFNIATNTLETAKGIELENLTSQSILNELSNGMYNGSLTETVNTENEDEETYSAVIKTERASYKLNIKVKDFADTAINQENVEQNVVKTVDVGVSYKYGGKEKNINLSTVVK